MKDSPLFDLGLDRDDLTWQQLAACKDVNPKYFDRIYHDKPSIRPVIDDLCLSCPVVKECLLAGIQNKESFVWGGHYLDGGEVVPELNDHKDEDFKQQLAARMK